MEMTEHIALYLRSNGFPNATSGLMPASPNRNATVFATGVRPRQDEDSSRFQIIVRGEPRNDTALGDAMAIAELLDDFQGITSIDSPYFDRILLEGGIASLGSDTEERTSYSLNFRAWYC